MATPEQIQAMHDMHAAWDELTDGIKEILRVKYIPVIAGWRDRDLDMYVAFLDSSASEQTEFMKSVPAEEIEFWIELLTARAIYKNPVDRNTGSITQDKVDAYPGRYRWDPDDGR